MGSRTARSMHGVKWIRICACLLAPRPPAVRRLQNKCLEVIRKIANNPGGLCISPSHPIQRHNHGAYGRKPLLTPVLCSQNGTILSDGKATVGVPESNCVQGTPRIARLCGPRCATVSGSKHRARIAHDPTVLAVHKRYGKQIPRRADVLARPRIASVIRAQHDPTCANGPSAGSVSKNHSVQILFDTAPLGVPVRTTVHRDVNLARFADRPAAARVHKENAVKIHEVIDEQRFPGASSIERPKHLGVTTHCVAPISLRKGQRKQILPTRRRILKEPRIGRGSWRRGGGNLATC
ncbi:hypothetical protein HRbin30_02163 [bacterium HR30]|nr:hypothetical protein HRbin30_02163 [bacterium HR30]